MSNRKKSKAIEVAFQLSGVMAAKWEGETLVIDVNYAGGHNNSTPERMRSNLEYRWNEDKLGNVVSKNYRLNDVTPKPG